MVRLAVSVAILAFFAWRIEPAEFARAFGTVNLPAYFASLFVAICGSLVISWKYFLLARGTGIETSFGRVVSINFIARFFGLLVPSGVGQGAVRWFKMTRNRGGKAYFLAASVFERLLFLTTAVLFVLVPLYTLQQPAAVAHLGARLAPVLAAAVLGLAIGFAYFFSPGLRSGLFRVAAKIPPLRRMRAGEALARLSVEELPRRRLLALAGLSVVWQVVYIGRVYALFLAVGEPMPFFQVAWISSLVFLLQVLPVSIAGLGLREGAYVYIFSLYGFQQNLGFLLGVLFFTHMLVFAAIGGILNVTEALSRSQG